MGKIEDKDSVLVDSVAWALFCEHRQEHREFMQDPIMGQGMDDIPDRNFKVGIMYWRMLARAAIEEVENKLKDSMGEK